ncbi:LysR family transcriptional regulator [uncultured Cohaesibacter sp.]|uniref:LysR family transcriptional regulator n=1 Tax=uncultured Cohaesibacter sp. TaxID=1002546 RepID=UPI0029C65A17|nr:LysR family transcriptional regulator [uncultured Cohaesibacter sp.]
MDIRQLRYFIAIAEARSISAAAQKLRIAQPSLSQHLVNMERELGVKLVERSARGSVLTNEGEILLGRAYEICQMVETCVSEIKELSGEVRGRVRFGMPPSVSMVMSVPLAETVRLDLPKVSAASQ